MASEPAADRQKIVHGEVEDGDCTKEIRKSVLLSFCTCKGKERKGIGFGRMGKGGVWLKVGTAGRSVFLAFRVSIWCRRADV